MKRYKLALLLSCAAGIATNSMAKPVIQTTPGLHAGISKTITETWKLTDAEKKNTAIATMMMSSLTATAIAPSGKVKRKEWTALTSQHKGCYYNTYGSTMSGRLNIKLTIAGQEVNSFETVTVGPGYAFCITRYLQMWLKAEAPGKVETKAWTHVDMDGQESENTGNGLIEVR